MRLAMSIFWPSFLAAALAELCFFALFDPAELAHLGGATLLTPTAVYSIGFLLFWTLCALACTLTCYLLVVPAGRRPPF